MTPEMIGRQESTNQKVRMELTLDLICNLALDGSQRDRIREILREKFSAAIEEEREACAKMVEDVYERELKIFASLKKYTDAPHCILEDLMNAIRARSS